MTIRIHIVGIIRQETDWQHFVEVEGTTPIECLDDLLSKYPGARKWIYDKHGKMWNIFQIYVNKKLIPRDKFSEPLCEGDELRIVLHFLGVKYGY